MNRPRYSTGRDEVDSAIAALLDILHPGPGQSDIAQELISACCGLVLDGSHRADLKLVSSAVRELRSTFYTFAPFRGIRKATVFGSARTAVHDPLYETAVELARAFANEEWMVVSGAGPGIMAATVEGAGPGSSLGVAIELPWEPEPTPLLANDPKVVMARHFFTRKIGLVKESHAFVCMPGGVGTLDEICELLTLVMRGKGQLAPIYLLETSDNGYWSSFLSFFAEHMASKGYVNPSDLSILRHETDVQAVVQGSIRFYTNYISTRYIGPDLLIRVKHPPTTTLIRSLAQRFDDILLGPNIEVSNFKSGRSSHSADEYGIRLRFDRRSFGRLYEMIDFLNAFAETPDCHPLP